ncbi:MAG: DUF5989 family protein [Aureliella sp.]
MNEPDKEPEQDFRSAAQQRQMSFLGEFWMFLRENKKWWLAPIVIGLSLLGLIAVLSATGLAPFIYTLF